MDTNSEQCSSSTGAVYGSSHAVNDNPLSAKVRKVVAEQSKTVEFSRHTCSDGNIKIVQKTSKPLKKRIVVRQTMLRKVRKSSESKYDHSSPTIRKTISNKQRVTSTHQQETKTDCRATPFLCQKPVIDTQLSFPLKTGGDIPTIPMDSGSPEELDEFILNQDFNDNEQQFKLQTSVSATEGYMYLLKQYNAIAPCTPTMRTFVLQDYDRDTALLKPHQFHFVSRRGVMVQEKPFWVMWCTCDASQAALVNSLSHQVTKMSHTDLLSNECQHVQCTRNIAKEIDAVHNITPNIEFDDHSYNLPCSNFDLKSLPSIVPIGITNSAMCVNVDEDYGVVEIHGGSILCTICKYGRSSCQHISKLKSIMFDLQSEGELPSYLENFQSLLINYCSSKTVVPTCVSVNKIPFDIPSNMIAVFKESVTSRYSLDNSGVAHLAPPMESTVSCSICKECSWSNDLFPITPSFLVTMQGLFPAKVYQRQCRCSVNCPGILTFDGQDRGILNMKLFCVTYEVLRSYLFHFLHGRTTMFTEYTVLEKMLGKMNDKPVSYYFKYHHFKSACYSFINMLDIDISDGFICSICGASPGIVVMDATSLSFRRALASWHQLNANRTQAPKAGR